MNEQLVVKNFGPIKDATVDFKRVTVFIGPTGGGKSTLAKLAAVFRNPNLYKLKRKDLASKQIYTNFSIKSFFSKTTEIFCERLNPYLKFVFINNKHVLDNRGYGFDFSFSDADTDAIELFIKFLNELQKGTGKSSEPLPAELNSYFYQLLEKAKANPVPKEKLKPLDVKLITPQEPHYIPAERIFVSTLEYSWTGLLRDDIGLPKVFLDFANAYSVSRKSVSKLNIHFLEAQYVHRDGQDFIKVPERRKLLRLYETASGIQSVTPMLVLLEHLSRNTEQAQSFIIEEPELNLYPTAQQGLLNWLVEKCTKGENDLTITTHSPYILSHLNLLLYAYQVAEQHPERADEVAELVPRASWLNPKEFACYQVENGGVSSLVNDDLGLIDDNALDGLSGDAADAFDNLIRLSKGVALK